MKGKRVEKGEQTAQQGTDPARKSGITLDPEIPISKQSPGSF